MRYEIKPHLAEILEKLSRKDKLAYEIINKKIKEIANCPNIEHYKNLKYDMSDYKEVHILKSFVLVFKLDKEKQLIEFIDFDHHDKIFPRRA